VQGRRQAQRSLEADIRLHLGVEQVNQLYRPVPGGFRSFAAATGSAGITSGIGHFFRRPLSPRGPVSVLAQSPAAASAEASVLRQFAPLQQVCF
jgi:hypothetical protein